MQPSVYRAALSVAKGLNKKRAQALIEQARLHEQRREWARIEEVLAPVVAEGAGAPVDAFAILGNVNDLEPLFMEALRSA